MSQSEKDWFYIVYFTKRIVCFPRKKDLVEFSVIFHNKYTLS